MRIAIVHDYLVQRGGAERVVEALSALWPRAPVYTSLYDPERMGPPYDRIDVQTSVLQRLPFLRRHFKLALPLYPLAFRSLELGSYDVVVSSSSAWAHTVGVDAGIAHIVYCHTPFRLLYRTSSYRRAERWPVAPLLPLLRRLDREAAGRATLYIANSTAVRDRIFRVYGLRAPVVYPPVETSRFSIGSPEDFYLCAGRLNDYKRVDLALRACEQLGRRLVVAGDGPARGRLQRMSRGSAEFLGRVSETELSGLLRRCRALIVPAEEDFCITAVEAMASGRPVIGYQVGGLRDSVVPDVTGVLFDEQTPAALASAIARFERLTLSPHETRARALRFDVRQFQQAMSAYVAEVGGSEQRAA